MRFLRRILMFFLWVIVSIVGLLLLISILVYVPPVQNLIKNTAARIVSEKLGMDLSIGRIRLRFPARLTVDNTILITADGDTLARVGRFSAKVALAPLLHGQITVPRMEMEDAGANYRDTVSGMHLSGTLGDLAIDNSGIRLSKRSADIGSVTLSRANVTLDLGEGTSPPDTTASDTVSMAWLITLRSLDMDNVAFKMTTWPDTTELNASIAKGQLQKLTVDLGSQDIEAGTLSIDDCYCSYLTGNSAAKPDVQPDVPATDDVKSKPWTVRLMRLELNDSAGRYGSLYGEPADGFDPAHIAAESINLRADSVFNRGAEISADITSLTLRERSGLEITECDGRFSMDSAAVRLSGFDLRTPSSWVKADADADASILEMSQNAKLTADISADISAADAFLFYPANDTLRNALKGKSFILNTRFSGTLGDISVGILKAQIPGNIDLQASGNVGSVTDPGHLSGSIKLTGTLRNIGFVKDMLPGNIRDKIGFPALTTIRGTVTATGSSYAPDLIVTADSGRIAVNGIINTRTETYKAELSADNFPLGTILPNDSLGSVTLKASVDGRRFDPLADNAAAEVTATIDRFEYKDHDFAGISVEAALKEHRLSGSIASDNDALRLNLKLDGELADSLYAVSLRGLVSKADIHAMKLAATPMEVSFMLDAKASAQMADSIYTANIALDSVQITHGTRTEKFGLTTLKALADRNSVTAEVLSGDLRLNFTSPESIATLANGFSLTAERIISQIDSMNIDMASIQKSMPAFKLDFSAARKNPLRDYLYRTGVDFNNISLTAGNGPEVPVQAGVVVNGLRTGGMMLDTLNVWLGQRADKLAYGIRVRNRPGNIDKMAFIGVGGSVSGRTLTANLVQRNRADSVGLRFGITAELLDSAIRATLTPLNPIFGYLPWKVNESNYFTYHFDKRMEADLRLEGKDQDQYFRITSSDSPDMPSGSVRLDISGFDIGEAMSLFPAAPPLQGILKGNGSIGLSEDIIKGDLSIGVNGLSYDGQQVGDVVLGAKANTDNNGLWHLDLDISANGKTALKALGTYDVAKTGDINMKVSIPDLQLGLANAFLPADIVQLAGTANGELSLTGTLDKPVFDGGIAFANASVTIPMAGTKYKISNERITIGNGMLNFNGFGLIAPNNQKLTLNGNVNISNLAAMRADLRLSASNFEAVNSSRNGGSQVYGLAAVDIDVSLRGLLDALVVRGNVNVLSRTNVYYTMRDSPLEVDEAKQDIVTFVSFADEETWANDDAAPLRRQSSMDVQVNVDIQDNVRATVNLSENGSNRIELIGNGVLAFIMNNQGDMRLTGRYTLSGGTVIYKLPVISEKEFGINDGSYVEWTGQIANPSFNITATDATQIKVIKEEGQAASLVTFDIIVSIKNTLENMAITFDLKAPRDGDIQNELQGLTPEERSSRAIYMLLTNTYRSDRYSTEKSGINVNQQIGAFISKELNQWARNNLKGVELSVGIDTVDEGGGSTHTDYSYSVSKSLFDDRFKVTIGGSLTDGPAQSGTTDNLVDDIAIEYRLTKRDNMFIKVYRYDTQENLIEGEIVETGAGFVLRRKMNKLRELFRLTSDPTMKRERQKARELRRRMREEEEQQGIDPAREQKQEVPMPAGNASGEGTAATDNPSTITTSDR